MEGPRFDSLTRRLVGAGSRRQVLRSLAATGAAALVARFGASEASAAEVTDCTGLRQTCQRRRECCGGGRRDCARISRACDKDRLRGENRCCGTEGAPCGDNSCFCCIGLVCGRDGQCEPE